MRGGPLFFVLAFLFSGAAAPETLLDHEVRLGPDGILLPWTDYETVIKGSIEYLVHCPARKTAHGKDPWYLITSKLREDGSFRANQNNQGGNAWFLVDTLVRRHALTGDNSLLPVARKLLDRMMLYHTPADWAWPGVPRTQDDSPDGQYTDSTSEPDKMCMAGGAYIRFFRFTGEKKYLEAARRVAGTVYAHAIPGDASHSPLPFRVNMNTGEVLDPYTSNMVAAVIFLDLLAEEKIEPERHKKLRDGIWAWIMAWPVKNMRWSGYFEDVKTNQENMNQLTALETARYMLEHPDREPSWREAVPPIIAWVEDRFGKARRFNAISLCEQDCCMFEMASHTARHASVLARWHKLTGDKEAKEKALAMFALSTYSAFSRHSKKGRSLNYVGVGYLDPWFSDSYFDYLPHLLSGMADLPEMRGR